jgi:hypothetical protein
MMMNNNTEFKSLFDFLGKAAGRELGLEVAKAALTEGILVTTKNVSNRQYKGEIKMYPVYWLEEYFDTGSTPSTKILYNEPDDLLL